MQLVVWWCWLCVFQFFHKEHHLLVVFLCFPMFSQWVSRLCVVQSALIGVHKPVTVWLKGLRLPSVRGEKVLKKRKPLIKNSSERGCGEEKGELEIIKGKMTAFTIYYMKCNCNGSKTRTATGRFGLKQWKWKCWQWNLNDNRNVNDWLYDN